MRLAIRVKPRSSKNKLVRNPDGTYVAHINASPVKGEANRALIKLLAEQFDIAKSSVRIVKGLTSKNKVISIGE